MLMLRLVSGVTISVLEKSIDPSPGWGMGKPTPAPPGSPVAPPLLGGGGLDAPAGGRTGKEFPEGMMTLSGTTAVAPQAAAAAGGEALEDAAAAAGGMATNEGVGVPSGTERADKLLATGDKLPAAPSAEKAADDDESAGAADMMIGGTGDLLVVGKAMVDVIASWSKHLTSSAVARSSGVCPSWFFRVGSAPWASNRAQSWVRPFCAASCNGVKPHLSVALTTVL